MTLGTGALRSIDSLASPHISPPPPTPPTPSVLGEPGRTRTMSDEAYRRARLREIARRSLESAPQ